MNQRHQAHVVVAGAGLAVVDALTVLKAERIGLVSPYPAELDRPSALNTFATSTTSKPWLRQ